MKEYNHKDIEKKWQNKWIEDKKYETKDKVEGKENEYVLVEFPYPSGNLHVGHWYAFAVTDIYARYRRMLGKNVLFPIGFDAFGLPAENAAIKNKVNPRDWTYSNIEFMEKQITNMGAMFDLSRKVVTADPEYYKWTQWLFIKLLQNNLAYQAENYVNWCPSCKTVLANEQVKEGKCDRCESEIEQKVMKEWKFKITDYAQKLLDGLDRVDWPSYIKDAQKNWIGKSHGVNIKNKIKDLNIEFEVYDSIPQTEFAQTFTVIAPEHPLVKELVKGMPQENEVLDFIEKIKKRRLKNKFDIDKNVEGIFTGRYVENYLGTGRDLPIWVASYVVLDYGTGIVNCSAHDERDFSFAKTYGIDLHPVLFPEDKELAEKVRNLEVFYREPDGILEEPAEFKGRRWDEVREDIIDYTEKNGWGYRITNYKLRDWSISRQRYWGCPIPIVYCDKCGAVPEKEENLPVVLPDLEDFTPRDDGKSPLAKAEDWVKTKCPTCGGDAQRETDTLDTFVDSSWYFLRYIDPRNQTAFSSIEKQKEWMPVNFYSGGSEHTTMHLLYARFFQKALFDLGLVNSDEPFVKRNNRGLILGPDGNKMSKSKGNVIDPDELVERLGADTVRSYLAFIGPYNEAGSYPWDPNGVVGVRRFIERFVALFEKISDSDSSEVTKLLHKTIKGVEEDYQNLKFNTALSKLMILSNLLDKEKFSKETYKTFVQLIAPINPHVAEELWSDLGEKYSVHDSVWPKFDGTKLVSDKLDISVQFSGRFRFRTEVDANLSDEEIEAYVGKLVQTKKWLLGQKPKRVIYIKGKIINFVV